MVTGACGTVGRELIRQFLEQHQPDELIGLDNNESELFALEQQLAKYGHANFFLADR
jgi:FlaA1/EpsC-like NDP-sugar epimerase